MDNSALLLEQLQKATNSGNAVTLRDDNARAFMLDAVNTASVIPKLFHHFAKSGTGSIDKLGVKRRTLREHKGIQTTPDGIDIKEEGTVPFQIVKMYVDSWIENDNVVYTAATRNQDVRVALTSLMQKQFMTDVQDLAFNGDESSSSPFFKLNDGFIKLAKQQAATEAVLEGAELPTIQELTEFTGNIPEELLNDTFKWHMSLATSLHYVNEIQNRQTPLGDSAIVDGKLSNLGGFGVQVVENMKKDVIIFTPTNNLAIVFGYTVKFETAPRDAMAVAKQATYHFMENDIDFIIREAKMVGYIEKKIGTPEG